MDKDPGSGSSPGAVPEKATLQERLNELDRMEKAELAALGRVETLSLDDDDLVEKLKAGIDATSKLKNFELEAIPEGELLGAFVSIRFGLVWKVTDTKSCDGLLPMLREPINHEFVDEKVLFTRSLHTERMRGVASVDLYKIKGDQNINLRMIDQELKKALIPPDIRPDPSESEVLIVSVIDEEGHALTLEKKTRGYAFAGTRIFEFLPFLSKEDLQNSALLTSDGSMLIRLALYTDKYFGPVNENETEEPKPNASDIESMKSSGERESLNRSKATNTELIKEEGMGKMDNSCFLMDAFKVRAKSFMGNPEYSDAVLNVIDENNELSIPIHRIIISAQSLEMASSLKENSVLTCKGYSANCVNRALAYMYGGDFALDGVCPFAGIMDLARFAEEFQVLGLQDCCIDRIFGLAARELLSIMAGIQVFVLGSKLGSIPLKNLAVSVFERYPTKQLNESDEFKKFLIEYPIQPFIKGFLCR